MMNNLGIHIYESNAAINWETEMVTINLISALSWKKYQGPIKLYCNTDYYNILKKWGVDSVYDEINTDILDNKSNDIDYGKYWAFGKFLALEDLIENSPFTLLDTDLILFDKLPEIKDANVVMFHNENFSENYEHNHYPDFDFMLPESIKSRNFDKKILPTNCALIKFSTTEFISEWIELAKQIARFNSENHSEVNDRHNSIRMCFVEQRLLPMLLQQRGITYQTYLETVYQSHLTEKQDGSEWLPLLDEASSSDHYILNNVKHVWGLKRFFGDDVIRSMVISLCLSKITEFELDNKPYKKLVDHMCRIYNPNQTLAELNR